MSPKKMWRGRGAPPAGYYAATDGTVNAYGDYARPWTLAYALAGGPSGTTVQPGDTVWLRGGTYTGRVDCTLAGTAIAPIVVRSYPGEWAKVDGSIGSAGAFVATITISGEYTRFRDFEVFCSSTDRDSAQSGSAPTDLDRGSPFFMQQTGSHPGIKIINMVIHDGTDGLSVWPSGIGAEVYGNIIYNNGWVGTDRVHGNAMYVQNTDPTMLVTNNIMFSGYDNGIIVYGSGSVMDYVELTGNTLCNSGAAGGGWNRNLLFGDGVGNPCNDGKFNNNYTWFSTQAGGSVHYLGYLGGLSDFEVKDNWFVNPGPPYTNESAMFGGTITNLTMTGNHFYPLISGVDSGDYPTNTYHLAAAPTGEFVYIRPNAYEPGRANVTVYNWDSHDTVAVDLSSVLSVNDQYEVRNAEDYFADPVLSGTYAGGSLNFPMTGLTAVQPIGGTTTVDPTGPEFNVFVVRKTS